MDRDPLVQEQPSTRSKGHQQTLSLSLSMKDTESRSSGRFLTSLLLFDHRNASLAAIDFGRTAPGLKTLLCAPVPSYRAAPTNSLVQILDLGRVKGTEVGSSLEMLGFITSKQLNVVWGKE